MSENFMKHLNYVVKSPKLLSPMSAFYCELIELCQKYDPDFPQVVTHLNITASPGRLVNWEVRAVEFADKE